MVNKKLILTYIKFVKNNNINTLNSTILNIEEENIGQIDIYLLNSLKTWVLKNIFFDTENYLVALFCSSIKGIESILPTCRPFL